MLKVKVTAPPEKGKANRAVIELLAGALLIHSRSVKLVSGCNRSNKVVSVEGLDDHQIKERLDRAASP